MLLEWACPNCKHRNEEDDIDEGHYNCQKCEISFLVEWEVSISEITPSKGWRKVSVSKDKGKKWKEGYHHLSYDPMISTLKEGDYIKLENDKTFVIEFTDTGRFIAKGLEDVKV